MRSRPDVENAGLVAGVVLVAGGRYGLHRVLPDIEVLQDAVPCRIALCHNDVRLQDSKFSGYEAAAVLEQRPVGLASLGLVLAALGAVDVGKVEPCIGDGQVRPELMEQLEGELVGPVPMLVLVLPECPVRRSGSRSALPESSERKRSRGSWRSR